ncbi:hypothetical protein PHYSODRAFT_259666 [Phytophthora sojae]|uniref:Fatty acid synthase beta subunit AflB /Fas1-like central domain-containing protein n=1 Tax=Phytophthora sojae (strain P6497) TaxID=1094619 RepID=G4Z7N9_PHYSP|nr:hypothetical protein PHYSODRAFT_259666 [Phytophthora sojae]EGZ21078.1 hypothetical protein PHYSODRAFT_259666 [Phytophthora sojae]|eukprot:XP_009523795.1 hypothetical protein PHYSODRAFT_259666 [Phytophthora sojae]
MEGKPQCWVHGTYFSRANKHIKRTEERSRRMSSGALFDQSELKSNPRGTLSAFIAKYPSMVSTLLSLPDCDIFLELCRTGGKPVNFVPAITKDFKTWFKKASLATDESAIPSAEEWLAALAASVGDKDWLKALISSTHVVGHKYVIDAAGIRVFDRSIDISGPVIEIAKKDTASAVLVNEVCPSVAELKVGIVSMEMTFQHHPELLCSIHAKGSGFIDKVMAFYARFWVAIEDKKEDSITKEDIVAYRAALGLSADEVGAAADFFTIVSWRPLIKSVFTKEVKGNLLDLVHLKHSHRLLSSLKMSAMFIPGDDIPSTSNVGSLHIDDCSSAAGSKVEIGTVELKSNEVNESPGVAFLHQVQPADANAGGMFANGGSHVPEKPLERNVPTNALAYAVASRDLNPIHRSKYAAILGHLPKGKPIMHASVCFDSNVVDYDVNFDGMVYPGDKLFMQARHIGLDDGKIVLAVEVVNGFGERVVSTRAVMKQAPMAFVFSDQGSAAVNMGMDRYQDSSVARFGTVMVHKNTKSITVHFGDPVTGEVTPLLPEIDEDTESYSFSATDGLLFATQFSQPALSLGEYAGVGPHFMEEVMYKVVDGIEAASGKLLQILNFNIQQRQYVVDGENVNLETLSLALAGFKAVKSTAPEEVEKVIAESLAQTRARKKKCEQSGRPFTLSRGLATTPLVGIDVPSHSRELLGGVPSFRALLRTKFDLQVLERQLPLLVNRYIPNLVATPFSLEPVLTSLLLFQAGDCIHGPELWSTDGTRSGTTLVLDIRTGSTGSFPRYLMTFAGQGYEATKSPFLAEVLDPMQLQLTTKAHLAHLLVVELLAYQFASGVHRFVEIDPAPTLTNMALRTVQVGDFPSVPREILWYQRHREVVHFEEATSNISASEYARGLAAEAVAEALAAAAKAATASAPKAKAAPAAPAPVAAPVVVAPLAPVQAAPAPAPAAEDAPVAALHILRVLLAVRMNKRARKPWT